MRWKECIERELVEKRTKNVELAKSLLKIATKRFNSFSKEYSLFGLEGIYETIIELCHALSSSFLCMPFIKMPTNLEI